MLFMLRGSSARRALAVAAIGAASLLGLSACGGGDDDSTSSTSGGGSSSAESVKVGSSLDLAPFEFTSAEGDPQGFEIDILSALGEKLNQQYEYVKTPFEQAFTGLASDKYRLNASAIFIRCERIAGADKVGEFTVPTYSEGQSLLVPEDKEGEITGLDSLQGKTVGVESKGSTADAFVDANKEKYGIKEKVIFPDTNALLLATQQGRVDAGMQSRLTLAYAIKDKEGLTVTDTIPGTEVPAGFVFRSGDTLRDQFNKELNAMKEDGSLAAIYEKWFGVAPEPDSPTVKVVPEVTPDTCVAAE